MARPKTGKIVARGPNTWRLYWELGEDPATGKRRQKTSTFHGTKEAARKQWRKIQAEIDQGRHVTSTPRGMTVRQWFQQWLTEDLPHRAQPPRPTTLQQYRDMTRWHIDPLLGDLLLTQVSPTAVQQAIATWATQPRRDGRAGTLSPTTVRTAFIVLRAGLQRAVELALLDQNPAARVKPPTKAAFQPQVWDAAAIRQFFAVARDHRWGVGYRLALLGGLRRGEILGLRWSAIDWDHGTITISETRVHVRGHDQVSQPKTATGFRRVVLDAETVAWLALRREQARLEQAAAGDAYADAGYVLQTALGRPIMTRNFLRAFAQLCAKAGVPRIRLHDLRHTHGTALHAAGVDLKTIAERLGHSQIAITAQYYVHPGLGPQAEAVRRLQVHWKTGEE